MRFYNKILAFIIVLLMTSFNPLIFKTNAYDKHYVDVTTDQTFSLNSVMVLIQHDLSLTKKEKIAKILNMRFNAVHSPRVFRRDQRMIIA